MILPFIKPDQHPKGYHPTVLAFLEAEDLALNGRTLPHELTRWNSILMGLRRGEKISFSAIERGRQCMESVLPSANFFRALGNECFLKGDFRAALDFDFESVLAADTPLSEAIPKANMASTWLELDEPRKALRLCEASLESANNSTALLNAQIALLHLSDFNAADKITAFGFASKMPEFKSAIWTARANPNSSVSKHFHKLPSLRNEYFNHSSSTRSRETNQKLASYSEAGICDPTRDGKVETQPSREFSQF